MTDNLRQHSIRNYVSDSDRATVEEIAAGSLQRIADACEKMAIRYTELIDRTDRAERWYADEQIRRRHLERQLSAAKGRITKLKKVKP